jgi:DNA-directed RNA polymerase specialized sigma24 family protein
VTAALSPSPDPPVSPTRAFGAAVSASEDAKAAIDRMRVAQEALDVARIERDRAIHRMRFVDEMSPPQIARALGLSVSLIRVTLRMPPP